MTGLISHENANGQVSYPYMANKCGTSSLA